MNYPVLLKILNDEIGSDRAAAVAARIADEMEADKARQWNEMIEHGAAYTAKRSALAARECHRKDMLEYGRITRRNQRPVYFAWLAFRWWAGRRPGR